MSECNNHLASAKRKPKSSVIEQKSATNTKNMSFNNEDSNVDYDSGEEILDTIVVIPSGQQHQQQRQSAALVPAISHTDTSSAFGPKISPTPKSSTSSANLASKMTSFISQASSPSGPNFSSTPTSLKGRAPLAVNMTSSINSPPSVLGPMFSSPSRSSKSRASLASNITSSISLAPSTPNTVTKSKPYFSVDIPLENWEPDSDSEDGRHLSLIQNSAEREQARKRRVNRSRKAKIGDKLKERWASGKMDSSVLSRKEFHKKKKDALAANARQNASQRGQAMPIKVRQQFGRPVPNAAYSQQIVRKQSQVTLMQPAQQPGRPEPQSLCVVCGNHAGSKCGSCNSVEYCSRACQAHDWELHRCVCQIYQSFLRGQPRPSPNHRRALLFSASNENPQFVWLSPGKYGPDVTHALSYLDEENLELKGTPVDCGELFLELSHRLQVWNRATALKEPLNMGIQKLGEGCLWKEWRGPIMVTSHTNDFLNSCLDVKPGDFTFIMRFLKDQIPKPNPLKPKEDFSEPVRPAPIAAKEGEFSLKI